jgi:hypothetical protein
MRGAALKEGARLIKWIWRGSWLRARLRGGMADEGAANKGVANETRPIKAWLMTIV